MEWDVTPSFLVVKFKSFIFSDASEVEAPKLKRMKNKDILLTLPGTLKIRDIKWLSVWCKRFTVNYGEIYIPKNLEIPEKVVSAFRLNSIAYLAELTKFLHV